MLILLDPRLARLCIGLDRPHQILENPTTDAFSRASAVLLDGPGAWGQLRAWRAAGERCGVVILTDAAPPDDRPQLEPVVLLRTQTSEALKTALGRLDQGALAGKIQLSGGMVDLDHRRFIRSDGVEVVLTGLEERLLAYLVGRSGRAVDREELQEQVWDHRKPLPTRTVDVTVSRLRKKIELDPANPVCLLTVRGDGYRLVPAHEAAATLPTPPDRRAIAQRARVELGRRTGFSAREAWQNLKALQPELKAALTESLTLQDAPTTAYLVEALDEVLRQEGTIAERHALFGSAIDAVLSDEDALARVQWGWSQVYGVEQFQEAHTLAQSARELATDPTLVVQATLWESHLVFLQSGPAEALGRLEWLEEVSLPRALRLVVMGAQLKLGGLQNRARASELESVFEGLVQEGELRSAIDVGMVRAPYLAQTNPDRALASLEQLYGWAAQAGDGENQGLIRLTSAKLLIDDGRFAEAERTLTEAEALYRRLEPVRAVEISALKARILSSLGQYQQARLLFSRALAWSSNLGLVSPQGSWLLHLSSLEILAGRGELAQVHSSDALRIARQTGYRIEQARLMGAEAALAAGNREEAQKLLIGLQPSGLKLSEQAELSLFRVILLGKAPDRTLLDQLGGSLGAGFRALEKHLLTLNLPPLPHEPLRRLTTLATLAR